MISVASRRTLPGWALDEVASAGRENHDAEHVARYDGKEDGGAPAEVTMLQERGLDADAVVVDLGAGTGQFTLAVAPVCAKVVAVDVSPQMLTLLRAKVAAAGSTVSGAGPSTRSTSAMSTPPTPGCSSPWSSALASPSKRRAIPTTASLPAIWPRLSDTTGLMARSTAGRPLSRTLVVLLDQVGPALRRA